MPGSKKGRGTMEADKRVSNDELPVYCNDMHDARHDESDVYALPLMDSNVLRLPKFESRYFDGNPADYTQFIKEFEVMLSGFNRSGPNSKALILFRVLFLNSFFIP
ncbi:unnamed protein product [Trichobilharzia regenti]|nr:unnamed protein product [Trichobilharzia regenti]